MKLGVLLCLMLMLGITGCNSDGGGGSGGNTIPGLYMLYTDAAHNTNQGQVSNNIQLLRQAGFEGIIVTFDAINPRPYTVPPGTPIGSLPNRRFPIKTIYNIVCNYSWDRNRISVILGPGGGYTEQSLQLAVQAHITYVPKSAPILLAWEATNPAAAAWTFELGSRLRSEQFNGTFYYNLIGSAGSAARSFSWANIGAIPAPSNGSGAVVNNQDGVRTPAENVPNHILNIVQDGREVWAWWPEGVNEAFGESLAETARRLAALRSGSTSIN